MFTVCDWADGRLKAVSGARILGLLSGPCHTPSLNASLSAHGADRLGECFIDCLCQFDSAVLLEIGQSPKNKGHGEIFLSTLTIRPCVRGAPIFRAIGYSQPDLYNRKKGDRIGRVEGVLVLS
jgi:hypothetical protein